VDREKSHGNWLGLAINNSFALVGGMHGPIIWGAKSLAANGKKLCIKNKKFLGAPIWEKCEARKNRWY